MGQGRKARGLQGKQIEEHILSLLRSGPIASYVLKSKITRKDLRTPPESVTAVLIRLKKQGAICQARKSIWQLTERPNVSVETN